MRVDLLTLYAFSDKAHAKQRELWRGFLTLIMPVLLECEASEFERMLESAQCRSVEQMIQSIDEPKTVGELIWAVSAQFADVLGFEPELGLSAFLDVSLPTRVHAVGFSHSQNKDNSVVGLWLKAFRDIQQRPEFVEIINEWKRAFEVFFEDEEAVLDEEGSESAEAVQESPEIAEPSAASASGGEPPAERRAHRRRKTG